MESMWLVHARTRRAYNLVAQKYHDLFHNEMSEKEYDRRLLDVTLRSATTGSLPSARKMGRDELDHLCADDRLGPGANSYREPLFVSPGLRRHG